MWSCNVSCLEWSPNTVKFKLSSIWNVANSAIIWMVLEPRVQVSEGFHILKLIRETNTKSEQTIQVIRVTFMSFFECKNGKIVLIILLVKLTKKPPRLWVLFVFLYFSFEAENSLLCLALLYQLFGNRNKISVLHFFILIFFLELYNFWIFCYFQLVIVLPYVAPRFHHSIHFLHFLSIGHPLLHHLVHFLFCQFRVIIL